MNNFDQLFFRAYTGADNEIRDVFHRHIFAIIEDLLLWIFFGMLIPGFLFSQDIFGLRSGISPLYSYIYILLIYAILMYKFFDWYVDTWIMTESSIVSLQWKWFTSDVLYIPYNKIEGIEIRTHSWWAALLGMSDVVVKLNGGDEFSLSSAAKPSNIVSYLQDALKGKKHTLAPDDREPFQILVESLSSVVKGHLATNGKDYITSDYIEKLDLTLKKGKPIDLRTHEEKEIVETWKHKIKPEKPDEHDEKEGDHSHH